MRFGCLASLALYGAVLLLVLPNGAGLLVISFGIAVVVTVRWLRSDWPLY
jgi:hypothetical protein